MVSCNFVGTFWSNHVLSEGKISHFHSTDSCIYALQCFLANHNCVKKIDINDFTCEGHVVGGANPVLDYTVLHWSRCNSHWCKYCFLNMSEDYISWEAVLREDFRKTIHSIFLLLSDLEIFHPVKSEKVRNRYGSL